MKRNLISLLALIFVAQWTFAVTPSYYSSADGKSGSNLVDALKTICNTGYSGIAYGSGKTCTKCVWSALVITDSYPSDSTDKAGKLWDMYSNVLWEGDRSGQCGEYSNVGSCYNREHSLPKSWFGVSSDNILIGPGTDLHHMYPTDGSVNNQRNNYPFGECDKGVYLINGDYKGTGRLGTSTLPGFTSIGIVWEPDDQYKGDFARTYMYMLMKWCANGTSFTQDASSGNYGQKTFNDTFTSEGNYGLTDYGVALLMKWHRQDPVSRKEIDRNNAVQTIQGNRNPFIDYPYLAEYLWGKKKDRTFLLANVVGSFEDAFIQGESDGNVTLPIEYAPPVNYYASVEGLQDAELKSALGILSNTGTRLSYGSGTKNKTWYGFYFTDRDTTDNSVIDMYSDNKRYFSTTDSTASVSGCNIEHMLPKSWWGGEDNGAYKDLYHLVPSDASANQSKSNWGPGVPDMTSPSVSKYGDFVTAPDAIHGLARCFSPADEYKGDFARAYFYVVTTYGDDFTWVTAAVTAGMTNDSYLEFQTWLSDLLMEWHRIDPVSEKEIRRAYEVNKIQGNRNPFIDYPCLAEYIWGTHKGEAVHMSSLISGYDGMNTDCCGSSDTPVPTTKYTITWSVDGETSTEQVTENEKPSAPSVTNCSENRVFRGWTTSSTVSEEPDDLYTAATIPVATKAATYYAVYADKETNSGEGAPIGTIMWAEDWTDATTKSSANDDATPSANYGKGTIVYDNAAVTYSQTDNTVYCRNENTGGGTAPELLLTGTKTWTISNIPTGGAKELTLTYKSNNTNSSVTCATLGTSVSGTSKEYTITTGGAETITISFNTSKNTRLDDISLVVKTSGSASVTTYKNYGLSCSTAKKVTITYHSNDGKDETLVQEALQNTETQLEANTFVRAHYSFDGWSLTAGGSKLYNDEGMIVPTEDIDLYAVWTEDPKYTVTFWNGEEVHKSVTNYAGEAIGEITDPESCEGYSFVGWSTNQYAAGNTETPEVSIPTVVPAANMYYYAVYRREVVVPGAPVYTKVTNTGNLENGKYLIVYEAGALAFDGSLGDPDVVSNSISVTINENTIAGSEAIDASTFTLTETSTSGVYTVQSASGYYIGQTSDANGMQKNKSVAYENTISFADGNADIVGSGGAYLRYNKTSGQTRFRYYKSTTYTSQQAIQLYKQTSTTGNSTTYYTTEPDCTPVVIPEYTLTFMSEGEKHDEVIGKEGEIWMVYDPESSCKEYTFSGWSEQTYATENTEMPVLVNDYTIPGENKTYYAVYTATKEAGSGLTNKYQKITSTSELTDANYLVVADTSKLLAMSTDWKNNYYLGSVEVTANDEVITTENSKIIWQIDENAGTITLNNSSAGYLYIEQSVKNEKTYYNIKLGDNTETNRFAYTVSEGVWVFSSATYSDRQLEFYTKNAYWSYYTGQDAPIYLYKQQEGTIYKTYYTTSPSCSSHPTDVEMVQELKSAQKVLIHGELYIIREGKIYTIQGTRVR